jgi:hypothetical protein
MALGMSLLCLQLLLQIILPDRSAAPMTVLASASLRGGDPVCDRLGMPIAFALGGVAVVFMAIYMPSASLDTVTQNVYEEMASITLLSIPLFILKGAAIGQSRAGQTIRLHAGCCIRRPRRCQRLLPLFAMAALARYLCCDRFGRHSRDAQGGLPAALQPASLPPAARSASCRASITMILFAVAAGKSLGRLFLAGIGPGLLLVSLFSIYAVFRFRKEFRLAQALYDKTGTEAAILHRDDFTMAERFTMLPRVIPFMLLLTGVMIALYGGYATPSETAGLGGPLAVPDRCDHRGSRAIFADHQGDDPRFHHADDDHRHVAPLFLRDELPASHSRPRRRSSPCTCRAGNCWRRSS